jgi:hypothetical protein
MEELCIKNITNGFRKLRLNGNMANAEMIETKQRIATALNRLKEINQYLYQDYLNDYKALLKR